MDQEIKKKYKFKSIHEMTTFNWIFNLQTRISREEEIYKQEVIRLEKDLADLEASVEVLRGEVINRRTRVNMAAVEDMALVLSRARFVVYFQLNYLLLFLFRSAPFLTNFFMVISHNEQQNSGGTQDALSKFATKSTQHFGQRNGKSVSWRKVFERWTRSFGSCIETLQKTYRNFSDFEKVMN